MQTLSIKEKVGYGLGDTASNIIFQLMLGYLVIFYTDVFGISAAHAGTLLLVATLIDTITDPIMGGISDRTKTRWGRYRPYLLWGAVPFALTAVAAFTTPDWDYTSKLIYAYITLTLLRTAYTVVNIPYGALGGVMSANPRERGVIQGYRFTLAQCGGLIVNLFLLKLVLYFGQGDEQLGYQYAIAALSSFAVFCFILCFLATRERIENVTGQGEKGLLDSTKGILSDLAMLFRSNSQWALVAAASFLLIVIAVFRGGATLFYTKYYLICTPGETLNLGFALIDLCNQADIGTLYMAGGSAAAISAGLVSIYLSRNFCKTKIAKVAALAFISVCVLMYFVPREDVLAAFAVHLVISFFHLIMVVMVFAKTADTVDWGEYKTGKRITGMTFSGHLFAIKAGATVGGALIGWILAWYHYAEPINGVEQVQSESALSGILLLMTLFPAICGALIFFFSSKYSLTTEKLEEIQAQIAARN